MKILIFTQYFWPENFRINDIASFLSSKKNEVTVITGYPNYPEGRIFKNFKKNRDKYSKLNNIKIIRIPIITRGNSRFKLLLNYISYIVSGFFFYNFFEKKIR